MRLNGKVLWVFFFLIPLLVVNVSAYEIDDYVPEITAKVSRITYLTGDVKIRRADNDDWERAVINLPVVEGDEITTDANALLEIQFDRDNYVRLAQNSYLKILTLKDEGVALSISQGILSVRILNFDKDDKYFEIDAPDTTVSIQREGMYRVDAGDSRSSEVRVSATERGEARVYSVNSGFTLKNGRSARIYLKGNLAGEFELADALQFFDEFDEWAVKRDALIAKRLKDAYYDKYYDRDVYGAEDLNEHGEWIYTRDYGYVWRPYSSAISDYDDWTPYRYGHWRWIPPYGWTWVNDEPWGWATYHHGRWVIYNGYWVWTPYEYYRPRRSWWSPALVVIVNVDNNICWYPLGHRSRYRGYHRRDRRDNRYNNPPIASNPNQTNPPTVRDPNGKPLKSNWEILLQKAVVSVPVSDFGRDTKGFRTVPADTAKRVLSKDPNATDDALILPTYRDLNGKVSRAIRSEKPPVAKPDPDVRIGATTRPNNAPLDKELRQKQIFGNRQPVETRTNTEVKGASSGSVEPSETRKTGAVTRPAVKQNNDDDASEQQTTPEPQKTLPSRSNERKSSGKSDQPSVYNPPVQQDEPARRETRQPKREEPRYEPPPRQEAPRYEPPKQRDEPKSEPPPRREEPKSEPSKRESPPPSKSEPKIDKSSESRPSKKDN